MVLLCLFILWRSVCVSWCVLFKDKWVCLGDFVANYDLRLCMKPYTGVARGVAQPHFSKYMMKYSNRGKKIKY